MDKHYVCVKKLEIQQRDIQEIMIAFASGFNDWCIDYSFADERRDASKSGHLVRGGVLVFDVVDDKVRYLLTREKLLEGIASYIEKYPENPIVDEVGEIDAGMIDAEIADTIVQLALFGELVYD